ncbi:MULTISPECIES: hypothetical protein [Pseudomonas]|uniref:hypothetical protein n=1 Tax=Pseudomonas TaxID=286 RepID=UPI001C0A8CED|nr:MULTISPECIES: hypothetical protein [Pseudomonas]MCK3838899.1 hypothetical protein [Pseudomonas sp. NCIMB 10586]VCU67829.1 hypothetical protein [Pseudomonas synxantha]
MFNLSLYVKSHVFNSAASAVALAKKDSSQKNINFAERLLQAKQGVSELMPQKATNGGEITNSEKYTKLQVDLKHISISQAQEGVVKKLQSRQPKPSCLTQFDTLAKSLSEAVIDDLKNRVITNKRSYSEIASDDRARKLQLRKLNESLPAPSAEQQQVLKYHYENLVGSSLNDYLRNGVRGSGGLDFNKLNNIFNDLFENRKSNIQLSSFRAIPYDNANYARAISVGDLVSDKGYLFTSVGTQNNEGFLNKEADQHYIYYRVDGYGSPMPDGPKFGEVDYSPGTVFRVRAIDNSVEHNSTYVWLEQVSAPGSAVVKDIYSGKVRV